MKKQLFFVASIFALVLVMSSLGSAYYYDDYKQEHIVRESYDRDGYTYYEKHTDKNPWGSVVTYKKIEDSARYNSYSNTVTDYWRYGNSAPRYLGYAWDDARNRDRYGQYSDYYYNPYYDRTRGYWDHSW